MKRLFSKKAQSTLEYAIIITVVVAALLAMQVYMKRGMQGKLRESSDQIGEQYSPRYTTSEFTTTSDQVSKEDIKGGVTTTDVTKGTQDRTGSETVQKQENEYWAK